MKSFKSYTNLHEQALNEEIIPSDFFDGFEFEVNSKASSSKRTVYRVRSSDRDTDRDEILRRLRQAGIDAKLSDTSSSSVDPIDGTFDDKAFRIEVKPLAGGMGETTLNSSITELFPCIAFELGYNPENIQDFHEWLLSVDTRKLECVDPKDTVAARETINKADTSTKFEDKMNNAMAILQFIKDQHNDKQIQNVYWGYRAKPAGVPKSHPGDMFIKYKDNKILGVSLKAGGKKTSEPQLNTYVRPVFTAMGETKALDALRKLSYEQVYSKIDGMPSLDSFDGGANGRHKDRRATEKTLKEYDKANNRSYEEDYDTMLEIMRKGIVNLFNKNKITTLKYIKEEILRDAPDVPTIVIKAIDSSYEEVTDRDAVGVFLPQVKFVKAMSSPKSKQNWFIILKSGDDSLTMNMSIRSNKSGHAGKKKLGQFPTGLAVKYNGLAK
jgi:hypothetical protein